MLERRLPPKQYLALRAVNDAERSGLRFQLVHSVAYLHNGRHRVRHTMVIFPPTYNALVKGELLEINGLDVLELTDAGRAALGPWSSDTPQRPPR